jgi:hypothetical protein
LNLIRFAPAEESGSNDPERNFREAVAWCRGFFLSGALLAAPGKVKDAIA